MLTRTVLDRLSVNHIKVGNYFHGITDDLHIIHTISMINGEYVFTYLNTPFAARHDGLVKFKDLKPIELTEEWHNNFGAFKNRFGNFEYDICPFHKEETKLVFAHDYLYIRYRYDDNPSKDHLITLWNKDLKYKFFVHEFQNLYESLTDNVLTIYNEKNV